MSQPPLTRPRSRRRGNSTASCDMSSMSAFLIFVGVNLYCIARLLLERRSVQLTEDELRLRQFPTAESCGRRQAVQDGNLGTH